MAEVHWVIPAAPQVTVDRRAGSIGGGVAFAISGLLAACFLATGEHGLAVFGTVVGVTVPVGWSLGRSAAAAQGAVNAVAEGVRMGLGTLVVGDLAVSFLLCLAGPAFWSGGSADQVPVDVAIYQAAAAPFVFMTAAVFGLVIFGPFVAIITVPCGIAWALLVRWLARRGGLVRPVGPHRGALVAPTS